MIIRSASIAEIDAHGARPDTTPLSALWRGEIAALRIRNLVSAESCQHISERLVASDSVVDHADVEGLRVVGLSHFQAARNPALVQRYLREGRHNAGTLRSLAAPYASPFDSAIAFVAQLWPAGCQLMELPTEGVLSPFTVRIYRSGVGIEPHQDILSAESPSDPVARSLVEQFGANLYLSMGTAGGALELYDTDYSGTGYTNLAEGPRVFDPRDLPDPTVTIVPVVGDLIIFPSRRIHAVSLSGGQDLRITVSFFIGIQGHRTPLKIWA